MSEVVEVRMAAECEVAPKGTLSSQPDTDDASPVGAEQSAPSMNNEERETSNRGVDVAAQPEPQTGAVPCELNDVGGPPHSAESSGNSPLVDKETNGSDDTTTTSSSVSNVLLDCSVVEPSVKAAAEVGVPASGGGASAGSSVTQGDPSGKSWPSSSVGRVAPSAARHALPSSVAAPRATGKHRLPPVLAAVSVQGVEQRTAPLSLVVGAHHQAADSASLIGGTRLGDLGLPPLNLSVADEAVNMKVIATTTQRSARDAVSRAGV